jgi:hypothetical protein
MLGPGIDVDMVTGEPLDPRHRDKRALQQQRYETEHERFMRLRSALGDAMGHAIVEILIDRLANRLIALATTDPECMTYLGIAGQIEREITIGRKAADALLGMSQYQAR